MGILRSLVRGSKPRKLNLAATLFEDDTPIRVGQMLAINSTLEELDVSNNWFGDEGAQVLIFDVYGKYKIKSNKDTKNKSIAFAVCFKSCRWIFYGDLL